MDELSLIQVIAQVARELAAPEAGEEALEAALVHVREQTGAEVSFDDEQRVMVRWPAGGGDSCPGRIRAGSGRRAGPCP